MPAATFHHSAPAAAAPSRIWETLQHASTWLGLGIMDEVGDEVREGDRLVAFSWSALAAGRHHRGTATVTTAEPGKSMQLHLHTGEMIGDLAVIIAGDGKSSVLDVTLAARSRGLIASMFWAKISETIGRGLPARVEEFAASF